MGLRRLASIIDALLAAGKPPTTPAAVIARGTLREQRVAIAPLAELPEAAAELEPPALIVIGPVVGLSARLGSAAWTSSASPATASARR